MSPFKLEDLPEDVKLTHEETKKYVGGVMGSPAVHLALFSGIRPGGTVVPTERKTTHQDGPNSSLPDTAPDYDPDP